MLLASRLITEYVRTGKQRRRRVAEGSLENALRESREKSGVVSVRTLYAPPGRIANSGGQGDQGIVRSTDDVTRKV